MTIARGLTNLPGIMPWLPHVNSKVPFWDEFEPHPLKAKIKTSMTLKRMMVFAGKFVQRIDVFVREFVVLSHFMSKTTIVRRI